jgi:ABC-type sugar transport system substrate-binding protein
MKRILALALAAAVASSATACDRGSAGTAKFTIGVSFYTKVIPLFVDMRKGMEQEAAKRGVKLDFAYGNNDAQAQVNQIQTFVNKNVDLIIASPVDADALTPAYKAAKSAKIPIFSVANKVEDADEDLFIGRDWSQFGYEMVKRLAQASGGRGKVGVIQGPPAINVVRAVSAGWKRGFAENPGLRPLQPLVDTDMSTTKALDLANTMFSSHRDLVGVVTTIDQIGLGVAQAAGEQKLDPKKLFIAGMDADPQALAQLKNGNGMDFTVSQRGFTWGAQAVDVAADWLNGKKPPGHVVENQMVIITKDNAGTLTAGELR